jgi:hypothetical protein
MGSVYHNVSCWPLCEGSQELGRDGVVHLSPYLLAVQLIWIPGFGDPEASYATVGDEDLPNKSLSNV